ncbi:MAG: hypothetical protein ACFFDF_17855 [Candidatus Odinarchaeota archaeon]
MNSEQLNIVNDPLDFIVWFLFNKKKKTGITRIMKSFQLFTIFDKFQEMGHFIANQFGGRDTSLDAIVYKYDNIILNIEEEQLYSRDEKFDFFKVSLLNQYKERLNEKVNDLIRGQENWDDFNLIKAIAYLSDKYSFNEYLRFNYALSPELTEKSRIKPDLFIIPDEIIRRETIDFLEYLPKKYAIEFLKKKLENIVKFSLVELDYKEDLKRILFDLLNCEKLNILIERIKDDVLKLINNVEFQNYRIILRNFLDIIIENEDKDLSIIEKLHLFKYLIFFHYITQKDLNDYYEYWKNSELKVIFGNEIENGEK